jgi:hypothetical protein
MTVVLVLGAIAVLAAVLIRALWRSSVDERHSVRDYHQTLETLRNLSDRGTDSPRSKRIAASRPEAASPARPEATPPARPDATPSGRERKSSRTLLGRSSSTADSTATQPQEEAAPGRTAPGVGPVKEPLGTSSAAADVDVSSGVSASVSAASQGAQERAQENAQEKGKRPDFVFDDNARVPANRAGASGSAFSGTEVRASAYRRTTPVQSRISRWRVPPTGSGRGSLFAVGVVVVLVALVAAVVAIGISSSGGKPSSSAAHASTRGTTHASTHGSSGGGSSAHDSAKSKRSKRSSSTTTVPPTIQPTTSSAVEAAYTAPAGNYTVALTATAPCWVEAEEVATGAVVFTSTLTAGQSQQIPATGDLSVRLGAAFVVTVTLNGEPITLPAGHGSPFDVTFLAPT